MDQPRAEDALRTLEPLVGEWTLTAAGPDGEPWPGEGRATADGRTIAARWEKAEDGTSFTTDFVLNYNRLG